MVRKTVKVEYDWKPPMCSECGVFGHTFSRCFKNVANMATNTKSFKENVKGNNAVNTEQKEANEQKEKNRVHVEDSDEGFVEVKRKKNIVYQAKTKEVKSPKKTPTKMPEAARGMKKRRLEVREIVTKNELKDMEIVDNFLNKRIMPTDDDMKGWSIDMISYYQKKEELVDKGKKDNTKVHNNKEFEDVLEEISGVAKCIGENEVKGLSTSDKQDEIVKLIQEEKLQICAVLETYLKSCRIMVGWNDDMSNIGVVHMARQSMLVRVETRGENLRLYGTFIYASNSGLERKDLWEDLERYKRIVGKDPWEAVKDVQMKIDKEPNNHELRSEEAHVLKLYFEAMKDEEIFLFQKEKVKWLSVGVKEFFDTGKILKEINSTLIALVPKIQYPLKVSDFRPIACCNVIYKFISKVLTERLKGCLDQLVSKNQSDFIPNRHIHDNIMLAQELFKGYDRKSGPKRVAVKSLSKDGLMDYEGNPISPYHFTLVMEILTLIIRRKVAQSKDFQYHFGCKNLKITNVCFADDLLMFCHADKDSVNVLKESIDEFGKVAGLIPNYNKSTIIFRRLNDDEKNELLAVMPFKVENLPIRYLGVPLTSKKLRDKEFIEDINKLLKNFLWQQFESSKGRAKVAWKNVYKYKQKGESLWVQWIHTEKLRGRSVSEVDIETNDSWGWKNILNLRKDARKFMFLKIGDGNRTLICLYVCCFFVPSIMLILAASSLVHSIDCLLCQTKANKLRVFLAVETSTRAFCNHQINIPNKQQQKTSGNEGTGIIPGVPDVTIYESESEKESWGDSDDEDEHDENNSNDLSDEGNEDNDGNNGNDGDDDDTNDDDKQEADDTNDDDEETDSDRTESDRIKIPILDQSTTEYYEEKEEEKIDDEETMYDDEYDEVTKESYEDVNVNLGNKDTEMTNAGQGASEQQNVSQESGFEQVEEDAHLLNLENPSPADNDFASLMETSACHAMTIPKITSGFTITFPLPPSFFNPLLQHATPAPTPTTSKATTSFTSLLDFASVFKFNERAPAWKKICQI
ncbi:RNA-directed DNA polymerase, eukaryota, reverse transcriptase zinc-binding domain protein [Tanacetum coccineum]